MRPFLYHPNPSKIIFGAGRISDLSKELQLLGVRKPLILATSAQRADGEKLLGLDGMPRGVICDQAVMHTPKDVTEKALALLREQQCDGMVSVGGGSTVGLAKALVLRTQLPHIAIPTTYAGSEVTPILGETLDGVKKTQRSRALFPDVVIYDVDSTLSLPASLSGSSGLNAIAHAAEALYAPDTNPVINLMAEEGIRALAQSLPVIALESQNIAARTQAQYGAWLCGTCLGSVEMSLHHKLCHVLGGAFNLPHAETHSIVLPYALAYNAPAAPEAMLRIHRALVGEKASGKPWEALYSLLRTLNLPTSLKAIGMPEDGVAHALKLVFKDSYWNPRPLEERAIERLLQMAFDGVAPT